MATYISLKKFTDQGIKDTVKRAEAFKETAKKTGVIGRKSITA